MCPHSPPCPDAHALDREAARTLVSHPEQGWSLLCNGVVAFEDTGVLLPGGRSIPPHQPADPTVTARPPRRPRPVTACAAAAGPVRAMRPDSARWLIVSPRPTAGGRTLRPSLPAAVVNTSPHPGDEGLQ